MSAKPHSTKVRSIIPLSDSNFYVYWDDELEHYHVTIDSAGNLTCHHRSDGRLCYPFCQRASCPHTERVEKYLAEQAGVKPLSPAKQYMAEGGSLTELFDYSSFAAPPTHVPTRRSKVAAR